MILKWKLLDGVYHAQKQGWVFNIYVLDDGKFNLIVDYKTAEMPDYDDIFENLSDAKNRAENILKGSVI